MAGFVHCTARITLGNGATLSKLLTKSLSKQQTANISSKVWRDLNGVKRLPPYDYKRYDFTLINSWFDKTSKRFDENTSVIVVEGPIASGKSEFAEKLAADLDMKYFPRATMDDFYINEYGFDLRTLDPKLPPGARSFDEQKFVNNPTHKAVAAFQYHMYQLKFSDYMNSLAHLFSTGEGVVLERSVYSDIVFLETLYRHNLMTKVSYKGLHEVRNNSLHELMQPHLVIYLDVPVDKTLENIKKRNKGGEANSPLFKDTKFLETMDNIYKREYLRDISAHAELLVYDWTNGGDVELVIEDIEKIDFDRFEREDTKMADWRMFHVEGDWHEVRMKYTSDRCITYSHTTLPLYHCPDLVIGPEDWMAQFLAYDNAPGSKYAFGYNEAAGDKDILVKTQKYYNPKLKEWDI